MLVAHRTLLLTKKIYLQPRILYLKTRSSLPGERLGWSRFALLRSCTRRVAAGMRFLRHFHLTSARYMSHDGRNTYTSYEPCAMEGWHGRSTQALWAAETASDEQAGR